MIFQYVVIIVIIIFLGGRDPSSATPIFCQAVPASYEVELTAFAHATLIGSFDPKPNMASLEKCVSSSRLPSRTVILLLMLE